MRVRLAAAWLVLLAAATPSPGQTSYPMVTRVQPTAIQRGHEAEVSISGQQDFSGASDLLFEGTGLSAEVLDAKSDPGPATTKRRGRATGSVRAKIKVAGDAALGPRELRVVTPHGVSSVGLVVVVADPVVAEADDAKNDDAKTAQEVALPAVISGTIGKTEDVDWFAFRAQAGQRLTFSVWANRLEDKIHDLQTHFDPILTLLDPNGRELAVDDNHSFADPMLSYEFREGGLYYLQIRDTTYAGNPNWTYVLHATGGPVVTSVFPMAVRPGETADLQLAGANLTAGQSIRLDIPSDLSPGPRALPLAIANSLTPPVPVVVTSLTIATESADSAAEPDKAQPIALPSALSGRLAEPNDTDAYRFEAKKGTLYSFEVMSRRVGSNADPVLRIVNEKGQTLTEADDTFGKDPRIMWTAPADGSYAVVVTDLHSRGGEGFGYVVLSEVAQPDFTLTCDPDKLNVGPGARTPLFVKVARRAGFDGPVTVLCEGLPPGVSASPLTIPPAMTQGVIVLAADADAKKAATLVRVTGSGETSRGTITHTATPHQEIYLPGGGRGLYDVATLAMAVTDPSDITVEAKPAEIRLSPGKTATIDVTVTRHGDFDKPVNLAVDLSHLGQVFASSLPPGVVLKQGGSKTLLGPKETTGKIILEARPDAAPCDGVPITVMGHVSINFVVKTAYCSAPIKVTVAR